MVKIRNALLVISDFKESSSVQPDEKKKKKEKRSLDLPKECVTQLKGMFKWKLLLGNQEL